MSSKGDINTQIALFIAQLKRREITGTREVATATATLLGRYISARRWHSAEDLIERVRELGSQLVAAQPHEFTCGNVVRRVLKSIRTVDEAMGFAAAAEERDARGSMFGLLSAPDQDSRSSDARARDQKSAIIDEIHMLHEEIANHDPLYKMGLDLISEHDVILFPSPGSKTVLEFLLRAGQKYKISVIVTENYPNRATEAHAAVQMLKKAGISSTLVPDAAVYAIMSKISKVVVSSRTVLANGGCIGASGVALACSAAKQFQKPVLAMAGSYKLSPVYPFDIDGLIEVGSSGKVIDFSDYNLMDKLEIMNPRFDYVPPDLIDIIITTDGSYSPNFIYRIVLDNYSAKDQDL